MLFPVVYVTCHLTKNFWTCGCLKIELPIFRITLYIEQDHDNFGAILIVLITNRGLISMLCGNIF